MNYKEKTIRIFNKYYSSFLKDLKEVDEDIRKQVKASYKVIDKSSSEYCDFFIENIMVDFDQLKKKNLEDSKDRLIAKGITLGDVLGSDSNKGIILSYVYILLLFAYMYKLEDEDGLFNQVIRMVGYIQGGQLEDYDKEKDDLIDDDIKEILEVIKEYGDVGKVDIQKEREALDPMSVLENLNNSKIASLAKEISKDIDLSAINTDKPEEMIKNIFDFSGNNNVLGNIIQKVSSTLNNKITSGEIKHDELIGEAMSMMNMFAGGNNPMAGNPLFNQMMKSMKTGKAGLKQDVIKKGDTRERLRKKLEMRNKNVE
jgi:hypothetical protein